MAAVIDALLRVLTMGFDTPPIKEWSAHPFSFEPGQTRMMAQGVAEEVTSIKSYFVLLCTPGMHPPCYEEAQDT